MEKSDFEFVKELNCKRVPPQRSKLALYTAFSIAAVFAFSRTLFEIFTPEEWSYGYTVIAMIVIPFFGFIVYYLFQNIFWASYSISHDGLISKRFNNKEFGQLLPWSCIGDIQIKRYKRSESLMIQLTQPVYFRFGPFWATEDEITIPADLFEQSVELLKNEIELGKQLALEFTS